MTATGIDRRRTLPVAATIAMRAMADSWQVRTMVCAAVSGSPGSILLINGRGDFIEKYAETVHDLSDAGWSVASFDWRGQGLSGRLGNAPEKGHADDFAPWLADLDALVAWFRATLPPPHYAVAHSMGGHLMLRHLTERGCEFDRVVLLSPMLGLRAQPIGAPLTRIIARLVVGLGGGEAYLPGGGAYLPREPGSVRQHMLTHDADRYSDEGWWIGQTPALAVGGATWGWLAAAFRSIAALFAGRALEGVATPVLVLVADQDGLVDNGGAAAAVARLPDGRLETFAPAGHELVRELPAVRVRVLARVTAFLETGA